MPRRNVVCVERFIIIVLLLKGISHYVAASHHTVSALITLARLIFRNRIGFITMTGVLATYQMELLLYRITTTDLLFRVYLKTNINTQICL